MPILRVINLDRRKPDSCFLNKFEKNINSQYGEDGIIEKIFEIIGASNKWCVEFGAWDGIYLSNTCHLIKDMGWSGVQIEANNERFNDLVNNFAGLKNLYQLNKIIGFERGKNSIDDVLQQTPIPRNFDLISIDIDGNDYHVWQSIHRYRPRVVVIEFNPTIPNDVVFIQDRDMKINAGASIAAHVELAKKKNYELVAVSFCNGFFVETDLFPKFGISDNSLDAMRMNVTGRIFHGFDGTMYNHSLAMHWAGNPRIARFDELQLLSPEERVYGDRLPTEVKDT